LIMTTDPFLSHLTFNAKLRNSCALQTIPVQVYYQA
jgi:hypothetical protein